MAATCRAFGRSLTDFRIQNRPNLHGLLPAEERLLEAVRLGKNCRLGSCRPTGATEENRVRVGFIRFLALGGCASAPVHEKGVQLVAAWIDGDVNLEDCNDIVPLQLRSCHIAGKIVFGNARMRHLILDGSQVNGVLGAFSTIDGILSLCHGFEINGEVSLQKASIRGIFACSGGRFTNTHSPALVCDNATIGGGVFFNGGFVAHGEVRLPGAEITGPLKCDGGRFENPGGATLICDRAKISYGVFLHQGFVAVGEVRLLSAQIGGQLQCDGGSFTNPAGIALNCDGAKIAGIVILGKKFMSEGMVRLVNAEIGMLNCGGGRFTNTHGVALACDGAKIMGDVLMDGEFLAQGEVRLLGARIDGQLGCEGRFSNPSGSALNCDGLKVSDCMYLQRAFVAEGEVRLPGAEIGINLECDGGQFINPNSVALNCTHAKIAGNVFLRGSIIEGELNLSSTHVGHDVDVSGGFFRNKGRSEVDTGTTSQVRICATAINLSRTRIDGLLWLGPTAPPFNKLVQIEGSFDLREAQIATLVDNKTCWPAPNVVGRNEEVLKCVIYLDGFIYKRFATGSSISVKDRKEWLLRQSPVDLGQEFKDQPFEQLIKVYREMGHKEDANKIGIFKRDKHLLTLGQWSKWCQILFWKWIGYGYRPYRAIFFGVLLFVLSGWFFYTAGANGVIVPANPSVFLNPALEKCAANWITCNHPVMQNEYPRFVPFAYAADMLLPIIDLGQGAAWSPMIRSFSLRLPSGETFYVPKWAAIVVMWVDIIFGWVVGLILTLILTGVVKRD